MNGMPEDDGLPEELEMFVEAQDTVWESVLTELAAGQKQGHWMWFVFPQTDGLGTSTVSVLYAIDGLEEAADYLAHPVLGKRLKEVTDLMLRHAGTPPERILGDVDALKFRSCMTLFSVADPDEPLFAAALEAFYAGQPDKRTLELLGL